MKGCEAMEEIIIKAFLEAILVTSLLYLFCFENDVAKWERRVWARFKKWLRRQLRKSDRIVAWAEKPTKHGRPDEEWITGQIQVWGEWR
jgi:hypothetical protein